MENFELCAAALYDGGWRSSDRAWMMNEYNLTEEERPIPRRRTIMKYYTITLSEADVKTIMIALSNRKNYFRRKANEAGNEFAELDKSVADNYKRLFEMFKAL